MPIHVLDENTINKIAAGEVIDRPSSIVKELVENAIDAKATAITVEIKEGGISLIRITDNGIGIPQEEVRLAFYPHATSKISDASDLFNITSLGFRGEALSSICAVSQVELITKVKDSLTATRYEIDGGVEHTMEQVGAPDGTTFLVRNLFFNTPARRKFLKTPTTEAGTIGSLMEHLAMSHPDISFRFIQNGQPKLQTVGNGNLKDVIYAIYGREIANNLIEIHGGNEAVQLTGYIGKPIVSRGNRTFENYYINHRYVKNSVITKAIEDAYASFIMQHKYPFTVFHLTINPDLIDVNVHPSKMEIRFSDAQSMYDLVKRVLYDALSHKELIPQVELDLPKESVVKPITTKIPETPVSTTPIENKVVSTPPLFVSKTVEEAPRIIPARMPEPFEAKRSVDYQKEFQKEAEAMKSEQLTLFENEELLRPQNEKNIKIVGQVFDTYWIIEFENNMYIVDQHAAHEKVLFEKFMKIYRNNEMTTQQLSPPVVVSLTIQEMNVLQMNLSCFEEMGFEVEEFGKDEIALRGIPSSFSHADPAELFMEIMDSITEDVRLSTPESIKDRIATMSCKAAVKGNNKLSSDEMQSLMHQLFDLDNPYNCPHGRPTMITMSKYELEKKFKRIV